jgi:hypothetical protein
MYAPTFQLVKQTWREAPAIVQTSPIEELVTQQLANVLLNSQTTLLLGSLLQSKTVSFRVWQRTFPIDSMSLEACPQLYPTQP